MIRKYILVDRVPVEVANVEEWGHWFMTADRMVDQTELPGDVTVSTVFVGIDHAFSDGPPLVFESMIFGGPYAEEMDRCSTWDEAVLMHRRLCALARMGLTLFTASVVTVL